MAIVEQTWAEKVRRAQEQDDQKRAFERSLQRSMKSVLNKIASDFKTLYTFTGAIVNVDNYQSDIATALKSSYRQVGNFFTKDWKRLLEEATDAGNANAAAMLDIRNESSEEINASLINSINNKALLQTSFILDTTNKNINEAIQKAQEELLTANEEINNSKVANKAYNSLKDINEWRSETIASTEVQSMSEGSKDLELMLSLPVGLVAVVPVPKKPTAIVRVAKPVEKVRRKINKWKRVYKELDLLHMAKPGFQRLDEYYNAVNALHRKHKRLLRFIQMLNKRNGNEGGDRAVAMLLQDAIRSSSRATEALVEEVTIAQDAKRTYKQPSEVAKPVKPVEVPEAKPVYKNLTISKTWVTVGDTKVRDAHMRANGQTVEVTQPFQVGGELLKYPGDTSLGASFANIINCRCVSVSS